MPQTTQENLDALAQFLDEVDDYTTQEYLVNRGYTLEGDFTWSHPNVKSKNYMTENEWQCMLYLIQEWDYGGLRG